MIISLHVYFLSQMVEKFENRSTFGKVMCKSRSGCPVVVFRLNALALSVIAMGTWLAGWLGGCLSQPVLYQND